jgi:hypothetical protein
VAGCLAYHFVSDTCLPFPFPLTVDRSDNDGALSDASIGGGGGTARASSASVIASKSNETAGIEIDHGKDERSRFY